jgi:hypothetical protein
MQDAIPLTEKNKLLAYYGGSYQFDLPMRQLLDVEIKARESVRQHLVEKRKRNGPMNSRDDFFQPALPKKKAKSNMLPSATQKSLIALDGSH